MAWLNATPERAKNDNTESPQFSRLEERRKAWMKRDSERLESDYHEPMPPLEHARHIIEYLFEIGPTIAGSMGAGPISHGEIGWWQQNMGIRLQPWEIKFLRRLSIEYLNESNRAIKRSCAAPWMENEVTQETKKEVANSMLEHFRRMAQD